MSIRLTVGLLIVVLATAASPGQTPLGTAFTYQGRLTNAGSPASGLHDLRFSLYDADSGGTLVGMTLCVDNVSVAAGLFTVPLDFGAQFAGEQRFLEIDVRTDAGLGCGNGAGFVTLSPRQALTAAPNALFALNADLLDGLDSSAFLSGVPVPLTLSGTSATHIIRGENAATGIQATAVYGLATGATGLTYGGRFTSASPSGRGVYGNALATSGFTFGGEFESLSSSGIGVSGLAVNANGPTYGVFGQSNSDSGRAVMGYAPTSGGITYGGYFYSQSTSGRGVFGIAAASSGINYGGYFHSQSPSGNGVFGLASALTGQTYGVFGQSSSSSSATAGVLGEALSTGAGNTYGVHGVSHSSNGNGVVGQVTAGFGITTGVYGVSDSTSGRGVFGLASTGTGITYGVYGQSNSTTGRGVVGEVTAATGTTNGVHGQTNSTSGVGVSGLALAGTGITYGGLFQSDSALGRGVFGSATSGTGANYGVYGQTVSSSDDSAGVFGSATAPTGNTYGGRFENSSASGVGVFGFATTTSGFAYGVYGESNSTGGRGVYGSATALSGTTSGVFGISSSPTGRGVYGVNTHEVSGYGVLGEHLGAPPPFVSYGVFSIGNMGSSGNKPFRIDHPDDPSNKYLLHYAAESPEVINFYRGTVTLDGRGEAVVELPHYFAKINKTPSYQLTAVGAPMPMLHVAVKISNADLSVGARAEPREVAPICSFRIAGGAPGGEVSWRVEAVRNDRWVQQRGAPVEVEKQGPERGTYQHPELYGQPEERGMNYRPEPELPSAALSNPNEATSFSAFAPK